MPPPGTLLDVLAGRNKAGQVRGSVFLNGKPKDANFAKVN